MDKMTRERLLSAGDTLSRTGSYLATNGNKICLICFKEKDDSLNQVRAKLTRKRRRFVAARQREG